MKKTKAQIKKEKINHVKKLAKQVHPKATPRDIFIEYGVMRIKKHLRLIDKDLKELSKIGAEIDFASALGTSEGVQTITSGSFSGINFLSDIIKKEVMDKYFTKEVVGTTNHGR